MKTKTMTRFGVLLSAGTLASGKDQPGPQTFSSASEAEAEIKFRNHYKAKVVKIKLTYDCLD